MVKEDPDKWHIIGRESRVVWKTVATELDLNYKAGTYNSPPVISGRLDGYYFEVTCTDDRPSEKSPETIYRIQYASTDSPVQIRREPRATRSRAARSISRKVDVEIDNPDFDRIAVIDAPSVGIAKGLLTPLRQQAITDLFATRPIKDALVTESETSFRTRKVENTPRRLMGNLVGLVKFAKVMGPPTKFDPSVERDPDAEQRTWRRRSSRRRGAEPELLSYFNPADSGKPSVSDTAS